MNTLELKALSDDIIQRDLKWKALEARVGASLSIDHVDLIQLTALAPGLKTLAGRLHSPKIQELPLDPSQPLTEAESHLIREYCGNDLAVTQQLLAKLKDQIELRASLSSEYGMELRSKSDAQIAEAVLSSELEKANGYRPKRPTIQPGTQVKYTVPDYISFKTEVLKDALEVVKKACFEIEDSGAIKMPKELSTLKLEIGSSTYQMGIGGLHSTEKSVCYTASEFEIVDRDVASYYPSIILNQRLYPKQCGRKFIDTYQSIVTRRLEAKAAKNNVVADTLKIVINGSFGKFGSKYSCLYSPDLLLQVTMSGQLSLLMLIESLELAGIPVVSANTDGIVCLVSPDNKEVYLETVSLWESITNFKTEETQYKAIYSRDVNNYIAVKLDGSCKLKGVYAKSNLSKNPNLEICIEAVREYLTKGTPIEETIMSCEDVTKFLSIRKVAGGAHKQGVYLGKMVRWYYGKNEKGTINYLKNDNKVPESDGAVPMMELTELPSDMNYKYYIKESKAILVELGVIKRKRGLF